MGKLATDSLAHDSPITPSTGDGMSSRIHAFDWSTTPLGALDRWPQSLRTAVQILLSSRYAMWMAWGPELTMLYNDSYRPTLGIKHPWALGKPAGAVWAEIWTDIKPRIDGVLTTGKATYDEGLFLILERSGFPEETYHTFSYSPLENDAGEISGMLCVVTEETDRFIGERRMETLRKVASALSSTITEAEVLRALDTTLDLNQKDLPFTLTYLFDTVDDDGSAETNGHFRNAAARLVSSSGISRTHPLAVECIEAGSDYPWPANRILTQPASRITETLSEKQKLASIPTGDWQKEAQQTVTVAIKHPGQDRPAGFFVAGANPFRRFDLSLDGFLDLLCGQIAGGLSNARAYEAERQRAEALAEIDRAKTTFFSNVSHELRTPLTLMLSPVEELLVKARNNSSREDFELLDLIHRNGLRLQKLVNTLLDFSRIEAGRMQAAFEPVDLARYTSELAGNFRSAMQRAGVDFIIDCDPLPETIYIDREMWGKIVLNLLSNALKFTFHGAVRIALKSVGETVELQVKDTGTGIPASELPHIFERFHRVEGTKGRTIEGTGIGLALVQELVKFHSGVISVKSEVGTGSSFTVSIPVGTAHLPKEHIRGMAQDAHGPGPAGKLVQEALQWLPRASATSSDEVFLEQAQSTERILFVDDNADMREYVGRLLGKRFQVVLACDGQEALAAAIANPPDLILSDVMMPGLDGFGLLAELRSRPETSTIPFILLSARAGEESRVDGLDAGADDYLVKPFTARELLARVGAHLSMQKRREEAERLVRRSNEELRRANSDLEQFAYSASHDLQEPLRQVAIYSQLLVKKFGAKLEPKAADYLAYCVEGAQRMEMLITDLLAYSQAGRDTPDSVELVDMNEVMLGVRKNLATAVSETGAVLTTSPLPKIYGNSVPLSHLFQNLVSNALKYRSERVPEIDISAVDDGEYWRFSVQDNGIGIPQEFEKQIFGIFKRLHDRKDYPGTGIGLAICQKIVEGYGGQIWVESEVGRGSSFLFTLPKEGPQ